MSMAADLRKPRAVYGHPKVRQDYAREPQRPTTRIDWIKAYVAVILSGAMIVGTIGTLVYMGNKLSPPHGVTGYP